MLLTTENTRKSNKIRKSWDMSEDSCEEENIRNKIDFEWGGQGHDSDTKHTNSMEYKRKSDLIDDLNEQMECDTIAVHLQ